MLKELFDTANKQMENTAVATFEYDSIFDITASLVLFQTCEVIKGFFEAYIVPILMKNEKSKLVAKDEQKLKKQQRKTYEYVFKTLIKYLRFFKYKSFTDYYVIF